MRIANQTRVGVTLACTLLTAISVIAGCPVGAQENHGVVKVLNQTVRLGAFLPSNSAVKGNIGNTLLCGGIDFTVQRPSAVQRAIVSIDYIDKSASNYHLQCVPVTYGQVTSNQSADLTKTNTYFGYGLGLYFTQIAVPDGTGFTQTNSKTLYGGYLNAGVNLTQTISLDVRYHATTSTHAGDPSGLELTAGLSF
jgi:hypothetical protein